MEGNVKLRFSAPTLEQMCENKEQNNAYNYHYWFVFWLGAQRRGVGFATTPNGDDASVTKRFCRKWYAATDIGTTIVGPPLPLGESGAARRITSLSRPLEPTRCSLTSPGRSPRGSAGVMVESSRAPLARVGDATGRRDGVSGPPVCGACRASRFASQGNASPGLSSQPSSGVVS